MGVNDLRRYAAAVSKGRYGASSGPADSKQVPGLKRPASNSGSREVPVHPTVAAVSRKALHGNGAPGQPEHGGARAGRKSGQPKLGGKGSRYPLSGGRQG